MSSEIKPSTFRSIAALLADHDPSALAEIRRTYPSEADLFSSAYVLGDDAREATADQTLAIRAFAVAGLAAAESKSQALTLALIRRLKRARTTKLAGSVIASISSLGVISALTLAQRETALITASVSLLSSITALIGEHISQPLAGGAKGVGELLREALGAEDKARELRTELELNRVSSNSDIVQFAKRVNEVASTVRSITVFGGVA